MSRFLPLFLVLAFFFCACMPPAENEVPSTEIQNAMIDSQFLHYRPVHHDMHDWVIIDEGNNLVLRAKADGKVKRLRTSARYADKRTVVREDGMIIGRVITGNGSIRFITVKNGVDQADSDISIDCESNGVAIVKASSNHIKIRFDANDKVAESSDWHVNRASRRRLMLEHTTPNSIESCGGEQLEMPFSTLGTLLFNSDSIPLPARFGLASHVSQYRFSCSE